MELSVPEVSGRIPKSIIASVLLIIIFSTVSAADVSHRWSEVSVMDEALDLQGQALVDSSDGVVDVQDELDLNGFNITGVDRIDAGVIAADQQATADLLMNGYSVLDTDNLQFSSEKGDVFFVQNNYSSSGGGEYRFQARDSSGVKQLIFKLNPSAADFYQDLDMEGNNLGNITGQRVGFVEDSDRYIYSRDQGDVFGGMKVVGGDFMAQEHSGDNSNIFAPFEMPDSDGVFFTEPTSSGGNDVDLRMYMEDDGDGSERFSIWSGSCGDGDCWNITSSTEKFRFGSDGNMNIYRGDLKMNGNSIQNVNSANPSGGNLGIGTSSPEAELDVNGDIVSNDAEQGTFFVKKYVGDVDNQAKFVILLHQYDTTDLDFTKGTFRALRDRRGSVDLEISAVSANTGLDIGSIRYMTSGDFLDEANLVTCDFNGETYLALDFPNPSSWTGFEEGVWFEGLHKSTASEGLRLVEYYAMDSDTVLNSEVDSSISDFESDGKSRYIIKNTNVGIGSDDPSSRLEVYNGTLEVDDPEIGGETFLYEMGNNDFRVEHTSGDSFWDTEGNDFTFEGGTNLHVTGSLDMNGNAVNNVGTLGDVDSTDHVDNLNADMLDSMELSDFAEDRRSYILHSSGGTEYFKIGEMRNRNCRFRMMLLGAKDQGAGSERSLEVYGFKRNNNAGAGHFMYGSSGQDANIIITETTNDANGDGYEDAYIYAVCEDYCQAKLVLEYRSGFDSDFQDGLGSGDIVGTEVYRSDSSGRGTLTVGTLNANTKNFVQSINSTHDAVYTAQESADARAVLEGSAELVDGSATIELPEHFSKVVSDERPDLNIQITPHSYISGSLGVTERSEEGFSVEGDEAMNIAFDYRVSGVREGYENKKVIRKN